MPSPLLVGSLFTLLLSIYSLGVPLQTLEALFSDLHCGFEEARCAVAYQVFLELLLL